MENQLKNQNSWWRGPNLIESDNRIEEFKKQPIKYYHPLLKSIDLGTPSILTLRGPRQVGKSTLIKLLIRKLLLEDKIDPRLICFYSCEDIDNHHDLINLIETYFKLTQLYNLKTKHAFIFLDEISFVTEWPRGIKSLYERGLLKDAFVLLSGSNSHDLRLEAERLPGRRGEVERPDKILLPVSFREYLELVDFPFKDKLPNLKIADILNKPAMANTLVDLIPMETEISKWLNCYFTTGGYLKPINDFSKNKNVPANTYETYLQWIRGDIAKLKRSEITAMHLFSQILTKMISRIDWSSLAKAIEIDSPKTAGDYIKILEDLFVLKIAYQFDISKKIVRPKKLKKIYFIDPFIFWAVRGWVEKWPNIFNFSLENLSASYPTLVEQHVFNTLNHGTDTSKFYEHTYFYADKSGAEIDFITFNERAKPVAIEVKFQNKFDMRDFGTILKSGVKTGFLITKNTLLPEVKEGFAVVPFYLWSLLKTV